jgi:hypothetical protein
MKTSRLALLGILIISVLVLAASPRPDVKTTSTTKLTFKGMLGTMMKLAGGNKPMTSTQYIRGRQSRTDNVDDEGKLTTSNIVDLDREVFISIDHKKKEYTEMTFAYYRNMLQRMGGKTEEKQEREKTEPEVKVSFEVKVDKTGEKKNIAGYHAEKVILTMTAKGEAQTEGGKPGEMNKGGMIVTSTNWLSNEVKGYEEVIAFHKAFAEKLGMMPGSSGLASVMENLMKNNPELAEALKKLEQEGKKMQGVALMTESVFETWAQPSATPAAAPEAKPEEQEKPKSVGGLLGGFGKKLGQKAMKKDDEAGDSGRKVLMESMTEITEISTASLSGEVFAVPAGYKKKEVKN